MLSRIYVKCEDDKKVDVEYYDYDNINKDGSSLVHIVEFIKDDRKIFNRIIRRCEFDDAFIYYISDAFLMENGWDDLKNFLSSKKIEYKYKKKLISSKERYKLQKEQDSTRRMIERGSIEEEFVNTYWNLNEYERDALIEGIKQGLILSKRNHKLEYSGYGIEVEHEEYVYMVKRDTHKNRKNRS